MSMTEDFGLNPLTEGFMGGGVMGALSEGFLSDAAVLQLEAAITVEAARYAALFLAELPEDVYADSGQVETINGVESPVELHKKFIVVKARMFAEIHVTMDLVALESNILTCSVDSIGLYEDRYLGWRWEGEVLEARRQRVSRVYALTAGLSITYLRARLFEIIGYYPIVFFFGDTEWEVGLDELGNETYLSGLWVKYRVDLVITEPPEIIERIEILLTRIEPARCSHIVNNNTSTPGLPTPTLLYWKLGFSALGVNTTLPI